MNIYNDLEYTDEEIIIWLY